MQHVAESEIHVVAIKKTKSINRKNKNHEYKIVQNIFHLIKFINDLLG